jgi:phytoene synthase
VANHELAAVVTRQTSFYYSFLVLPKAQREAITAVFDVCRAIDDSVDLEPDADRAKAALEGWRAEIARVFGGSVPETAPGRRLQPFVTPFHLPRDQFDALIDGVAMDVTPRRYADFSELEPYCHRVASSVGLMCAAIFGIRDAAVLAYARDLGVALQLTNILRDVGVDYQRGRCYLPLDDLARFRCTEADLARETARRTPGLADERVRALLDHQAARARVFFARATRALPKQDAPRFVAAEIMRAIYWDLLRRIEANGFDVFPAVIRVPTLVRAWIALTMVTRTKIRSGLRTRSGLRPRTPGE